MRALIAVPAVLFASLALAGCGGSGSDSAKDTPSPGLSGSSTPTPGPSTTATSTAKPGRGGTPLCGTPDLTVAISADPGGGTAGATHETISFVNHASHACTLDGYAGVSLVAGDRQVGAAAQRTDASARTEVTLASGGRSAATLTVADPGVYPGCHPTAYDGVKVYPPHNRRAVTLPQKGTGCSSSKAPLLQIGPVQGVA